MFPLGKKTTLLLLVLIAVLYYLTRPKKKASELIQEVIDYSDYLDETVAQMRGFFTENTYDTLVMNRVKPATDQIASIRKQTEIYEGMQRIPGGPQNFMTTSLAALEKLQKDLWEWEAEYRLTTARLGKVWTVLSKRTESSIDRLGYFDSDTFHEPLAALQIYFQLVDFVDPNRTKKAPTGTTLDQILKLISSKLLPLVEELERLKISNNQSPHFHVSDLTDLKLLEVLKNLMDHLSGYSKYYEIVSTHWIEEVKVLKQMALGIDKMDLAKIRYEELASGIDNDIISLQERIKKLKYPKQNSEEL